MLNSMDFSPSHLRHKSHRTSHSPLLGSFNFLFIAFDPISQRTTSAMEDTDCPALK